jgi:hypothetical protein
MIRRIACVLALLAAPALAVDTGAGSTGTIRVLDKTTGAVTDLSMAPGEQRAIGFLTVQMDECRYPAANPTGDAYILVEILDSRQADPVFRGWLIATAPSLSAVDHPRYDIWALSCAN